jgi:hypothetical protein
MSKELHLPAEAFKQGIRPEIIVREAKALDEQPVIDWTLQGNIQAPGEFLTKRMMIGHELLQEVDGKHSLIHPANCVVMIDVKNQSIVLIQRTNAETQESTVTGRLKKDHVIDGLQINNLTQTKDAKTLGKFLKKYGNYFSDREEFNGLIDKLFKFSAEIQTTIIAESEQKGNSKNALEKKVSNSLPDRFTLSLPIFNGFPKETIVVEIWTEVTTDRVVFWLESIDLLEKEQEIAKKILDTEAEIFQSFGCPVIYV